MHLHVSSALWSYFVSYAQPAISVFRLLLGQVTGVVTVNLNKIIDVNYYPVETARRSNFRHRPIGIGVQGLADAFMLLGMAFDSPEVNCTPNSYSSWTLTLINWLVWLFSGNQFQAQKLNKDIFETIYYHALKASSEIAAREGPYETYVGSPVSKVCWVSSNASTSSAICIMCYSFQIFYFPFHYIKKSQRSCCYPFIA